MKKSYLVGFTCLLLAGITLAGCNPSSSTTTTSSSDTTTTSPSGPVAKKMTVGQLTEIDLETRKSVYDGELVYIEDVVVSTIIENSFIVQEQVLTDQANPLRHMEILGSDTVVNHMDVVKVEGIVSMNLGHVCISDAIVTITESYETTDKGVYNFINFGRTFFNNYASIPNSGMIVNGIVQPCGELTTLENGKGGTFKVVFPGEDTNTENPDNPYLIDLVVPANVSADAVKRWNEEIVPQVNKLGGLSLFASVYYNEGYFELICDEFGILAGSMDSAGNFSYATYAVEITGVYKDWASASAALSPNYILPSDFATFPSLANEDVFSFVVNTDDYFYDFDSFGGLITITCNSYNVTKVLEDYTNALLESGWILAAEQDGYTVYQNEIGSVLFLLSSTLNSVDIEIHNYNPAMYTAEGASSAASMIETYTSYVQAYEASKILNFGKLDETGSEPVSKWTTALVDPSNAITSAKSQVYLTTFFRSYEEDLIEAKQLNEYIQVIYQVSGGSTQEINTNANAVYTNYVDDLLEAGFVLSVFKTDDEGNETLGYWNAESREMVLVKNVYTGSGYFFALALDVYVYDTSLPGPAPKA